MFRALYQFYSLLFFVCYFTIGSFVNAQPAGKLYAEDFFRSAVIQDAALSLNGEKVALQIGSEIYMYSNQIDLQRLSFMSLYYQTASVYWLDNDILVLEQVHERTGQYKFLFLEVSVKDGEFKVTDESRIESDGYIIKYHSEKKMLTFAKLDSDDGELYANVYNIEMFKKAKLRPEDFDKINRQSDNIVHWIIGASGKPVVGISHEGGKTAIWASTRSRRKLSKSWEMDNEIYLAPYHYDKDSQHLLAVTDLDSDKQRAVILDLGNRQIEKVLFEKENADVNAIVMDSENSAPIAVTYLKNGLTHYEHLVTDEDSFLKELRSLLPDGQMDLLGSSQNQSKHLLLNTPEQSVASLYSCDTSQNSCEFITSLHPWLEGTKLATTHTLQVPTDDGLMLEAFLTLPNRKSDNVPLVVMPHGGPIGVRDTDYFNPDAQWLAYNGFATLRVNYRGSKGYGNEFLKKGFEQWGRAIEEDIELATDFAIEKFSELLHSNKCIYGSSYGGYSALMGIIRDSSRYRCAVSFAGVTDLSLLFSPYSVRQNAKLREFLVKVVGDPTSDLETLQYYSPLYQYQKITTPLLLIHGTEDNVVDIEHAWRLNLMLDSAGIKHNFLVFDDLGHSFSTTGQVELFYDRVVKFLNLHLE